MLTPEDIAAKKAYAVQYHRNVRKPRMQHPIYKARLAMQERERYKKRNPNFKPREYGKYAGKAVRFSESRPVNGISMLVMTYLGAAKTLNIRLSSLLTWLKQGKFPGATLTTDEGEKVWHIEEIDAMATVLQKRLEGRGLFMSSYTDVIEELFEVITELNNEEK